MARVALCSIHEDPAIQAERDWVAALVEAVIAPRTDEWRKLVDSMLLSGCRAVDFLDIYIPATAQRLGADWVADRAGFAQVTLGCARLDRMLNWATAALEEVDEMSAVAQGRVCLIAPVGAQHRLSQHVFAAQLLRRGIVARTVHPGDLEEDANVVMISASGCEDIDCLRATVARARAMGPAPLVILGGGAVQIARRVCDSAGADLVTDDIALAVTRCHTPVSANWGRP